MLSNEQRESLRGMLEEERNQLEQTIDRLDADQSADDTNAGVGNHPAEDALLTDTQTQMLSMRREHEGRLGLVQEALRRMESGDYGTCERCGQEIAFDRLEALPSARFCLSCQREIEDRADLVR